MSRHVDRRKVITRKADGRMLDSMWSGFFTHMTTGHCLVPKRERERVPHIDVHVYQFPPDIHSTTPVLMYV